MFESMNNGHRPIFRFMGRPEQMKQQSELAFLAQSVYFHLTGGNGTPAGSVGIRELAELGVKLKSTGVIVASPAWFAQALSDPLSN